MHSWDYQRKTNRPPRADKGKKKEPRVNTHMQWQVPPNTTRTEFLDTIAFVRGLQ